MLRHMVWGTVVLGAAGCVAPPEAPQELGELSRYLFREWDNPDPRVMSAGLRQLESFLTDVDLDDDAKDRSWVVEDLVAGDVHDIERPEDRNLVDCLGVSVSGNSRWNIEDHARLQTEVDQTITEPTANEYQRLFPELEDPSCFWDGSCPRLLTVNDARRSNFLMGVDFVLYKDMQWVELSEGRRGISGRSWFAESFEGDSGGAMLYQTYAIDLWMERDEATTWRYQVVWSESDVGPFGDDTVIATIRNGTDAIFRAGESAIEELYHAQ